MDVKAALLKKYGPFPGWAWAGLIALTGWLLMPRLSALTGSSRAGGTPIYAPGPPGAGPQGPQGPQGPPGPAATSPITGPQPPPSLQAIADKWNVSANLIRQYLARFREPGFAEAFAGTNPVNAGQVTGYQTYLNAPIGKAVTEAQSAGLGGPAPSIGSRRAETMSAHHPDLKRPPRIPHVVQGIGGPGQQRAAAAHRAAVHRAAAAAGTHPARLLALNPYPSGLVHIQ